MSQSTSNNTTSNNQKQQNKSAEKSACCMDSRLRGNDEKTGSKPPHNLLNKHVAVYLAWLCAILGTFFSLILSNLYHWEICHLCWYQRICLYPSVIILGIACFRQDSNIGYYLLPITIIGSLISLYQYLEQMIPGFAPIDVCGSGPSCSNIHLLLAGFITLPFIGLVGFVVMSILLFMALRAK